MLKYKLGIDFHGVLNKDPEFFSKLTSMLSGDIEIHIITGGYSWEVARRLKEWDIKYDKLFSIPEYHARIGTKTWINECGEFTMNTTTWDKTKGEYCARENINKMIDDTLAYKDYMPDTTSFYHYK